MKKKLSSASGAALVIALMILLVAVLAVIALLPVIRNKTKEQLDKVDAQYETQARRDAGTEYTQTGRAFTAVYDSERKSFIDPSDYESVSAIPAYGTGAEHEGMLLLVTVDASGTVSLEWVEPRSLRGYGSATP